MPAEFVALMSGLVGVLNSPFSGTMIGAFLGAFFGYLFSLLLKERETRAKRRALFEVLAEESFLAADYSTIISEDQRFLSPIGCLAAERLLDGQTLSYGKHRDAIQALLELIRRLSAFNRAVEHCNANYYGETKVSPGVLSDYLDDRLRDLVGVWLAALKRAPKGDLAKVDEAVRKLSEAERASNSLV